MQAHYTIRAIAVKSAGIPRRDPVSRAVAGVQVVLDSAHRLLKTLPFVAGVVCAYVHSVVPIVMHAIKNAIKNAFTPWFAGLFC